MKKQMKSQDEESDEESTSTSNEPLDILEYFDYCRKY